MSLSDHTCSHLPPQTLTHSQAHMGLSCGSGPGEARINQLWLRSGQPLLSAPVSLPPPLPPSFALKNLIRPAEEPPGRTAGPRDRNSQAEILSLSKPPVLARAGGGENGGLERENSEHAPGPVRPHHLGREAENPRNPGLTRSPLPVPAIWSGLSTCL